MDEEAATAEAGQASKRLKYQFPDLKVIVGGSDDDSEAEEFEAYSILLCANSPYFDTMLSTKMKEGNEGVISFPHKDPNVWKLFYSEFIDPCGEAVITNDNVLILLPWFHEFMMKKYVKLCDKYLAGSYFNGFHLSKDDKFWNPIKRSGEGLKQHERRLKQRKDEFSKIIKVLQVAMEYELRSAKNAAEKKIAGLTEELTCTNDLFDFPTVKILIQCIPPLYLNSETHELNIKEGERWFGECKDLWPIFQKLVFPHASMLTQEVLDNETCFSTLVYSCFKMEVEKRKAENDRRKLRAAKRIIITLGNDVSEKLYDELPRKKTMEEGKINCVVSRHLEGIVKGYHSGKHREDFKKIGFESNDPSSWQ